VTPVSLEDGLLLAAVRAHPGCLASRLVARGGNAGGTAARLNRLAGLGLLKRSKSRPYRYWIVERPGTQLRLPRRAA